MICPFCNSHIQDDLEICPACRKQLSGAHYDDKPEYTFCKQCGSLLKEGDVTCPSCGMYCDEHDMGPVISSVNIPELDPGATNALPRIDSAIPKEDVEDEVVKTPVKPYAVAGGLAVLFVTVLALAIVHPWDPAAYYGRPDQPLDFSENGPAQIESLAGQDKKAQSQSLMENIDPYDVLNSSYLKIIELSESVDEIQLRFRNFGFSDNQDEIDKAYKETRLIAIDISNEINHLKSFNFTGTDYEPQRQKLMKLANFLRNRVDGYSSAWGVSKDSKNREADRQKIESHIQTARTNQGSFDEIKAQCEPKRFDG